MNSVVLKKNFSNVFLMLQQTAAEEVLVCLLMTTLVRSIRSFSTNLVCKVLSYIRGAKSCLVLQPCPLLLALCSMLLLPYSVQNSASRIRLGLAIYQ